MGGGTPEEEPIGCLQTDLFFKALEGRKLAPEKRERKARMQTLEPEAQALRPDLQATGSVTLGPYFSLSLAFSSVK